MNLIREIFDYILSLLKSRIVPLVAVFLVLLSVIINRIFSLQIVNGESYVKDLTSTVQKTTSVAATRGRIFDRNGVLLAYNDLAFSVRISDSGTYKDTTEKNIILNKAIDKTLDIIESKGDKFTNDFPVEATGYGGYDFTVSGNTLLRLKRDIYGTRSISELTDEQKKSMKKNELKHTLKEAAIKLYETKEAEFPEPEQIREIERVVLLKVIDNKWMSHLDDMDALREGIGLQAYGQRDPVVEYKMQGYELYEAMMAAIQEETVRILFHIRVEQKIERESAARVTGTNKDATPVAPKKREEQKIYPNDPCPCGSGKKYKQCCGRIK